MISSTFASDLYYLSQNLDKNRYFGQLKKASAFFKGTQTKKVFHGSPSEIKKFNAAKESDNAKMLFGHGLYFTGSREIAERYRLARYTEGVHDEIRLKTSSGILPLSEALPLINALFLEQQIDVNQLTTLIKYTVRGKNKYGDLLTAENIVRHQWQNEELANGLKNLRENNIEPLHDGYLYEVELSLNEEKTLIWEKPWIEQSTYIQKKMMAHFPDINLSSTVKDWYDFKSLELTAKKVSDLLESIGINGIRYEEPKEQGVFNYVVFNENNVKITQVHDNQNRTHDYSNSSDGFRLSDLDHELFTSQVNKDLKHDIKILYKKHGIRATSHSKTRDDAIPMISLLESNYRKNKRNEDLFDGITLFRGTKDMNSSLGTFNDSFLHVTPMIDVAIGYATHINDDIGFNAQGTRNIGKITEYALSDDIVFYPNFGIENNESPQTKKELLQNVLPLVKAYSENPSSENYANLKRYIHINMYEVALDINTKPINSYICVDSDLYPIISEFEPLERKLTDLNHASLITYGLNHFIDSINNIADNEDYHERFPDEFLKLNIIKNEINHIISAYKNSYVYQSETLSIAEKRRQETLAMLDLNQIGQSNGNIHFDKHPQLSTLTTLRHQYMEQMELLNSKNKEWVRNNVQTFIDSKSNIENKYLLSIEDIKTSQHDLNQKLAAKNESSFNKTQHLRKILNKINEMKNDSAKKSSGLFGWFYKLTAEKKDQQQIQKSIKYYSNNKKQLNIIQSEIEEIKDNLEDIEHRKEKITISYKEDIQKIDRDWDSFVKTSGYVISNFLNDRFFDVSSLTLDENFFHRWKIINSNHSENNTPASSELSNDMNF